MASFVNRSILRSSGWLIVTLFIAVLAPMLSARDQGLLVLGLLFAIMALGLQLVVGFCQLFDLGFAGFVCLGAYTTAVLMVDLAWSFLPSAAISMAVAFAFGVLLGIPTLKLESDYFAIVTFGLAELVVMLVRNWESVTRGSYGFGGVPDPIVWGMVVSRFPPLNYVYLMGFCLLAIYALVSYIKGSLLGRQMITVGEGHAYSSLCGVDSVAIKVAAFGLSAAIGGLAGSLWAVYFKFLSPLDFSLLLSVQVLVIVILGGGVSPGRVAVAGLLLGPLGEYLRRIVRDAGLGAGSWVIVFGLLLMALSRGGITSGRKEAAPGSRKPYGEIWRSSRSYRSEL